MKLKKITLYYRELKEWLDMTDSELDGKNVIIFKTSEGGLGIREQCHGWKTGDCSMDCRRAEALNGNRRRLTQGCQEAA